MTETERKEFIDAFWSWIEPTLSGYSQTIQHLLETLTDKQLEDFMYERRIGTPPGEGPSDPDYIVEVVRDFNTFYGLLSRDDIIDILEESDLKKRDTMVLDRLRPTEVGGDDECDLSIVIDGQPAEERWGDHEDDWRDAVSEMDDEEDEDDD